MRKTWAKCFFAVFCVLSLALGAILGAYILLYAGEDFYNGADCWRLMMDDRRAAVDYYNLTLIGDDLNYSGRQQLQEYEQRLDAANTNFRYRYYDPDQNLLSTNVPDGENVEIYYWYMGYEEVVVYLDNGEWDGYDYNEIEYGVTVPLTADDAYSSAMAQLERIQGNLPALGASALGCLAFALFLLIVLFCVAGRREKVEGAVLNRQDRIPYDLYLAAAVFLFILCGALWVESASFAVRYQFWVDTLAFLLLPQLMAAILVAFLLTTATRIKTRTLFRNTIIWRLCKAIWRLGGAAVRAFRTLPMVWRAVALFLCYLAGTLLTGITIFLIPFYQGFVLWLLCRWVLQWRKIRDATGAIVAGQTDVNIRHDRFYPDLYRHAAQLNDLGSAVDHAVEERLKSERFKAELITNVSHDLKTPLTSIINYVDLLKKEDISNPTAREYIEVLDRKSQRLKKLTEDLVEASKASTGALAVNKERLNVAQLADQAAGEYKERLTAAGLTLVASLPEEPVWVEADGRHLWRVLDNLLGNCVKYSMEGTRVYLDVHAWDGNVALSVKNISRSPLNIPAEQLLERFVRGDESRTTEGSGLGLSIARSLTELQGGTFHLSIDGDLFKAIVILPLA